MSAESESEEPDPGDRMTNYASWYRFLSQERQSNVFDLTTKLREVLDGFQSFGLPQWGEKHRLLRLAFRPEGMTRDLTYDFDEVSEGQRVLVALYRLLYAFRDEGHTSCLDEPDKFVALREIQPWLMELQDTCLGGSGQAVLVSHHPEITNYLAPSCGFWLAREAEAPVRVTKLAGTGEEGLQLSEIIARGWGDG